jgi:site-specific DNA-methyltransferase (cytosine-N4-specific)
MFSLGNTASAKNYRDWCQYQEITAHPARMQASLVEIFINYLTEPGDLVFDPFGGSNTTGFIAEKNKRNWIITEMESKYLLGSIGRFDPQEVKIEWKN